MTSYTDGNFSLNRPNSEIYRKCNVEILASLASVQMIAPCQTVVNFNNILRATFVLKNLEDFNRCTIVQFCSKLYKEKLLFLAQA